ncbi:hypothetical protein ISR94_03405 [Candidatus Microgenomates bacterium]|nr:hypothetical protein [Candidatus Microgenomates bacterium]
MKNVNFVKKISKHLPHYISLIGIFVATVLAFYLFSYDRFFLVGVSLAFSLAYIAWGIIHHLIHKDLTFLVVIEYISMSVLGLIIILSLIFRN